MRLSLTWRWTLESLGQRSRHGSYLDEESLYVVVTPARAKASDRRRQL